MAARKATNPDGREWKIVVLRFRSPKWRDSDYQPEGTGDLWFSVIEYVVLAPFFWFVVPLACGIIEWPVTLVRAPFSSTRWIEARCSSPSEITIVWRASKQDADAAADEIAARLRLGYEELTPSGATFVSMSQPPGLDDP